MPHYRIRMNIKHAIDITANTPAEAREVANNTSLCDWDQYEQSQVIEEVDNKQQYNYKGSLNRWDTSAGVYLPITRQRLSYLLLAARSRHDTIHVEHYSSSRHGYTIGNLIIRPTK